MSTHVPKHQSGEVERLLTQDPRAAQIVRYGGVVYLTGQVGNKETLKTSDIKQQTAETLHKIDKLLAAAGTDKSRLLEARIWVKDMTKDFAPMNAVWNAWVDSNNKPTRVCVEANMADPLMRVEIQVTAATGAIQRGSKL